MIRNVLEYLENATKNNANKLAFVDQENSFSFSQTEEKAKRMGTALSILVTDNKPVPVIMKKSAYEIIVFFGCSYAGKAYVPIDAEMPQKRIEKILETVEASVVIVDEYGAEKMKEVSFSGSVVSATDLEEYEVREDVIKKNRRAAIDTDLLYVIFTSGSTGIPKGVAVNHRAVIDFTEWFSETASFDKDCVFGNQAPFYFDMSVKDIYGTIRNGATMFVIPKRLFSFPGELFEYIADNNINTIAWAASIINFAAKDTYFMNHLPNTLKTVCFGGEALPVKALDVWRKYLPDALYMNMYGPTETVVDCAYHIVDNDRIYTTTYFPIGTPCENTAIVILNENRQTKQGEIGEICVKGTGLACGYYNDTEKTASVFIQNPLQKAYPEILYKTGDRGYIDENGEIMFVSRKDKQIKHMGYRIELGEIETALLKVRGIEMCCCFYDEGKDKIVCIYSGDATKKEIILEVKKYIPKYMWPSVFVLLGEMPLNPNGKIDRIRLKAEYIHG